MHVFIILKILQLASIKLIQQKLHRMPFLIFLILENFKILICLSKFVIKITYFVTDVLKVSSDLHEAACYFKSNFNSYGDAKLRRRNITLWKWIKGTLLKLKSRSPESWALSLYSPLAFPDSSRKKYTLPSPTVEAYFFSQWETITTLNCSLSSNGLSFKAAPPGFAFFYIKELFFVLWTRLWFAEAYTSQIAIPVLFTNKLFFAGK